jgi:predicted glycogen debranching enzyme
MPSLEQTPAPGERLLRFAGDRVGFSLQAAGADPWPAGWRAFLRTNLGRAAAMREEIIAAVRSESPRTLASWRDIPLERRDHGWGIDLPLTEVGYFRAKTYALDSRGWQHWPDGPDTGINVQPAGCRTANIIYCAFTRMFGPAREGAGAHSPAFEDRLRALDQQGYTVIPPSGRFRDLIQAVPHIFDTLGCRILHLLPVNPTPTTYARFGRFGSPYACQDLTAIDPALVEFDKRTTGVDQFRELAYAVHSRGGRLFLDMVINHTGWGSTLLEQHPDWFLRRTDGAFVSPGAWGVTWEDLVELEHRHPALRERLGEAFLTWCRRGVDGFRCDAGYKVPLPVWQYVTARVRQEFPETVFLLEGLGGSWEDTEALLTEGGLQWAYSELFQNYHPLQVSGYLDHALRQSGRAGLLIHYSETHDNERLAAKGRDWSLLRNRLCALASVSGGYGFTCGVEWLASERIQVHANRSLAWDNPDNLVNELSHLNRLLADHPCFFDGAALTRLSPPDAPVFALLRVSREGTDAVLVLVNTDLQEPRSLTLPPGALAHPALAAGGGDGDPLVDALGQSPPERRSDGRGGVTFQLPAGGAYCLSGTRSTRGLSGEAYRRRRAREALALQTLSRHLPLEQLGAVDVHRLGDWVERDLEGLLAAAAAVGARAVAGEPGANGLIERLEAATGQFPRVETWRLADRRRILSLPPGHWLVVRDEAPFRARLDPRAGRSLVTVTSIPLGDEHAACLLPPPALRLAVDAALTLERYADDEHLAVAATVRLLASEPVLFGGGWSHRPATELILLTNGRGGMARLGADLGRVTSKYDCLLGANLHPAVPVDRHVFVKRLRVWVNADGFISPLNAASLAGFSEGPPARWRFLAHAGDGRAVAITLTADLLQDRNTTVLRFERADVDPREQRELPPACDVRVSVRLDLEDRNFHWETQRNPGAEHHFASHIALLEGRPGFSFTPAPDRSLRAFADAGTYHPQPEWCEDIPHPVEASRGMTVAGDAYSPGWFELPLRHLEPVTLVVCADPHDPSREETDRFATRRLELQDQALRRAALPEADLFGRKLALAVQAFVARRGQGKTVIAGYPWFLDWGRDTLISARGLVAAGLLDEVRDTLGVFARFERDGTLPNTIRGEDASNRDTSDAPLWFGVACEELAASAPAQAQELYQQPLDSAGRTLADVLGSIAAGFLRGTPNGIRVDPSSGLVWSPRHFTWMDTDHPAGTPREGYPVEIQALWLRLLRQLDHLGVPARGESWAGLATRAHASLEELFWIEDRGYYADVLLASPGEPASAASVDNALRSNGLFLVSLGLARGRRAQSCVEAARRHLLVPGAIRSLAPLPVFPPHPIHGPDGRLLNDPTEPYWGRYEGDEDTRRKPAYHNGTAWTWTFPAFCEALARAWEFSPDALTAARAWLGSLDRLLSEGCLGHLPEILDGDAPHLARGCDAQAWSVTEALRVWRLLHQPCTSAPSGPAAS